MLKHRTKSEAVYDILREQILSGALKPDERLTLARLSQEYGVSLMPVREALMRLERENLVEITPYKDARVAPMSRRDIDELFSMRAALEAHSAVLAFRRDGDGLAPPLEQINARFRAAVEAQDFRAISDVNLVFHNFILERANNNHLRRFMEDIWSKCTRYRAGFRLIPGRSAAAVDEHERIIAAIRKGDVDAIAKEITRHIETAGREMAAYLDGAEPA